MTDAELSFLTKGIERLITEVAGLRDDINVLAACVSRLEVSTLKLTNELHSH